MDWQEQALKLRCGTRTRIPHCKDDNSMLINHDLKGVSSYCFRCGFHGFLPHGVQRIADLVRRAKEYRAKSTGKPLVLPDDYTLDIPSHARAWYLQYGITAELAQCYSIGYSPDLERVVLPVYEAGELSAIQMRAVSEELKPKYLNPSAVPIQNVLFNSSEEKADIGVVVEDILSCIKVGQILPCSSTLGTKMSDARAYKLSNKYKSVIVWYDNDKAGRIGARKAIRQLELLGVETHRINTELDPKEYTRNQIKKILKEYMRDD